MESQGWKDDGDGFTQTRLGQSSGGFIRELVLEECWCWLTEGLRHTECCLLLMVGTAVQHGLSHTGELLLAWFGNSWAYC